MTSEPGLILTFNGLSEQQAGTYICAASYASSERLASNITIKTMGKYSITHNRLKSNNN